MPQSINRVVLTGNLTRDPELRSSGSLNICTLRVACNSRRKNGQTQEWEDKPNYFDVVVFGAQGENCNRYLAKGRGVAVDGRLDWREWEHEGSKRQAVQIIADTVQFLGDGKSDGQSQQRNSNGTDMPVDTSDFDPPPVSVGADEEIPF